MSGRMTEHTVSKVSLTTESGTEVLFDVIDFDGEVAYEVAPRMTLAPAGIELPDGRIDAFLGRPRRQPGSVVYARVGQAPQRTKET